MNLNIPIYVEGMQPGGGATVYTARPLFTDAPRVRGEKLERLMTRLAQDLGRRLTDLAQTK